MPVPSPTPARRGAGSAVAIVLVGLLLAACSSSKKPAASGSGTPSGTHPASTQPSPSSTAPPQANFVAAGVKADDAQDRTSVNDAANATAKQVENLVNTYYNDAFLQPSQWGDGAFPSLSGLFTSDAATSVGANLQTLALGPLAKQIARVTPTKETESTVNVLIEADGTPSYATVITRFEARATPSAGGPAVVILQSAQFMIQASGGSYHIAGYDVSTSFSGTSTSASYGGPIGGSA